MNRQRGKQKRYGFCSQHGHLANILSTFLVPAPERHHVSDVCSDPTVLVEGEMCKHTVSRRRGQELIVHTLKMTPWRTSPLSWALQDEKESARQRRSGLLGEKAK